MANKTIDTLLQIKKNSEEIARIARISQLGLEFIAITIKGNLDAETKLELIEEIINKTTEEILKDY